MVFPSHHGYAAERSFGRTRKTQTRCLDRRAQALREHRRRCGTSLACLVATRDQHARASSGPSVKSALDVRSHQARRFRPDSPIRYSGRVDGLLLQDVGPFEIARDRPLALPADRGDSGRRRLPQDDRHRREGNERPCDLARVVAHFALHIFAPLA